MSQCNWKTIKNNFDCSFVVMIDPRFDQFRQNLFREIDHPRSLWSTLCKLCCLFTIISRSIVPKLNYLHTESVMRALTITLHIALEKGGSVALRSHLARAKMMNGVFFRMKLYVLQIRYANRIIPPISSHASHACVLRPWWMYGDPSI